MARFTLCVLICSLYLGFSSCENDIEVVKNVTVKSDLPALSSKEAELIYSDSARIKVKLKAPEMDRYMGLDPRIIMPKGVNISFYNDSMLVITHLTSNYAIRKEHDYTMEARNNVVVVNRKGDTLHTEKLIWDERKRLIYTDVNVLITTAGGDILRGKGLEANEDFTHYRIKGPIGEKATPAAP
jgi:LPS export ABC transporter protein LptC